MTPNSSISREQFEKSSKVENLIWEIAKILEPNSYIEPRKIKEIQKMMSLALTENESWN